MKEVRRRPEGFTGQTLLVVPEPQQRLLATSPLLAGLHVTHAGFFPRAPGHYVYSDNDFILLGKIVESITGLPLDKYVHNTFYNRIGLSTMSFNPWLRFGTERVVPTQMENGFRKQLLRGYVHDEGAALFGGVAGHAGLFSDAFDLYLLRNKSTEDKPLFSKAI